MAEIAGLRGNVDYDGADCDGGDKPHQIVLKRLFRATLIPSKNCSKGSSPEMTPLAHFVRVNYNSSYQPSAGFRNDHWSY